MNLLVFDHPALRQGWGSRDDVPDLPVVTAAQTTRPTLDDVLRVGGMISRAPLDLSIWSVALHEIARLTGANASGLFLHDTRSFHPLLVENWNLDPASMREYEAYYHTKDLWIRAFDQMTPGEPRLLSELVPDREFLASEHFNDFLRPQDIAAAASMATIKSAGLFGHLTMYYPLHGCRPSGDELRVLRQLEPFVTSAIRTTVQLSQLQAQVDAAQKTLDQLPFGVVVLDRVKRVAHINAPARAVFKRGELQICRGRMACGNAHDESRLAELVNAALGSATQPAHAASLSIPREQGRPLGLIAIPAESQQLVYLGVQGAVVIFLVDPDDQRRPPAALLSTLFSLSPAEARLLATFVEQPQLRDAANQVHMTYETARTTLKIICAKTGTKGQTELLRHVQRYLPYRDATG